MAVLDDVGTIGYEALTASAAIFPADLVRLQAHWESRPLEFKRDGREAERNKCQGQPAEHRAKGS
jgi:hypothetical protein